MALLASRPGPGRARGFKLAYVTLPADPLAQLKTAELTIARLEAERDRLESLVIRLGALAAEFDAEGVVQGVTEAARISPAPRWPCSCPRNWPPSANLQSSANPAPWARCPSRRECRSWRGRCGGSRRSALTTPSRPTPQIQGTGAFRTASRSAAGWARRFGLATVMRLVGCLSPIIAPRRSGREEEMVQGLAAHLGASLDNLAIFQERSGVARALQQTLLPPELPEIPGVDFASRYRPAKSMALVGGDFYDMFEVRPGVWSLIMGDVSGVGPEAAALTGIARYAVRALASQGASPAKILSQLNETLVRFGLQDRFCTMLYGELRPDGDVLRVKIANGGHPYPLVLRADGWVEELDIHGTLLGLLNEVTLEERDVELAPGDLLVGYTDGVTEARDPAGEFFGPDGLANVLVGCAGRPAAWVAQRIELAVLEHQAGVTPDDVAIVVVQALPQQVG